MMNRTKDTVGSINIYDLGLKKLWVFISCQDLSYWLTCGYLFFEYIRPQTLYPVLDIMPYSQVIITVNFLFLLIRLDLNVSSIGNRFLILFLVIIFFSSVFAISSEISFQHISEFIAWVLIYYIIINTVNSEAKFLFFILLFLLFSFKMAQFSFRNWFEMGFAFGKDGTGGGPGWFENSGEFGVQMCIFFPLGLYFFLALKEYWSKWKASFFLLFPIFALSGMISSSSRGAVVGGAAILLWILFKSKKKFIALFFLIFTIAVIVVAMPAQQKERFGNVGDDKTSNTRIERWKKGIEMSKRYPVLGVGFENWAVADSKLFFLGDGGEPHNIFIECLAELGWVGMLCFLAMVGICFRLNSQTRRQALKVKNHFLEKMAHGLDCSLVGFLASGFFVTVLYYPYFWINFSLVVALNNITNNYLYDEPVII